MSARDDKMAEANKWLDRAIVKEQNDGTFSSMAEKMLNKACELEKEANTLPRE